MKNQKVNASQGNIISKRLSVFLAYGVFATTSALLAIWFFIPRWKEFSAGSMKVNTALALLFASIALLILRKDPSEISKRKQIGGKIFALVTLSIGALTAAEYLFGWNLGIDQLLVPDFINDESRLFPGRMSPIAAICFISLGISLLTIDTPSKLSIHWPTLFTVPMLVIALLAIVGYIFGAHSFYQFGPYIRIAWQTVLCLSALSFGILESRPSRGFAAIISSPTMGGVIARRALPTAIIVPIILGWLGLEALKMGLVDLPLGAALLVVVLILTSCTLITISAKRLVASESKIRQAEEALRQNEFKFRRIFEADMVGLIYWSPEGDVIEANNNFLRSIGYTREDMEAGKINWRKLTPPEWSAVSENAFKQMAANGTAPPFEKEYIKKDGSRVPVIVGSASLEGVPGVRGIACILDISERKRIERERDKIHDELVKSEENYRQIVESVRDHAIYLLDPKGSILSWNPGAEKVKGYRAEEVVGKNASIFYSKEDIARGKPQSELEIAAREGKYEDESLRIRKDGSSFWASVVISAIRDEHGALKGFAKIVRDINRRKEDALALKDANESLERRVQERTKDLAKSIAELARAREVAEKANRIKDDFLAVLSHELRTPLTTILGWSQQLLAKEGLPAPVVDGLSVIERNAYVQGQLINDLLDVSRIQAGKLSLDAKVIDLVEVLRLAIKSVQNIADKKSILIKMSFGPPACMILADATRVQQVFWNLLTNAIKFTPRGGEIFVKLSTIDSPFGKEARIQVCDNGKGIKSEFLPHIFERFSQEDSSMTRHHGGLGLGLTLVKSLVEMQDGTVAVESQGEGKGATFTVNFPLIPAENIPPRMAGPKVVKIAPEPLEGVRLLIVDDNIDNLDLFDDMLRSSGAEVRLARSAVQARQMMAESIPDILISDISMPEEDGYSLIHKIRALGPESGGNLPVIALTAYAGTDDVRRILGAGFSAHVAKPVEKAKLLQTIAKLVDARRLQMA